MVESQIHMQALPPLQWSRLVQARYTPLQWKIYFLNLQLSYKKDIPHYNLVRENEQVLNKTYPLYTDIYTSKQDIPPLQW